MTSRGGGGPQYHPLQDSGEDSVLVDSPDSSETGLLLQQQRQQQQLPRPHTTTAAAAAATTGAGATPGGAAVEAGDRSTSPASVAAARGDGGHGLGHGQQRSRPPSSMGGAADAGAAEAGAAAGAEGGGGEGPSLALRVKTLDSKEHRVAVPATATVAELKARIAQAVPGAAGKFLRLITQGKLLSPDAATLATFKVADEAVVHCVMSDRPPGARALAGPHIGIDGLDDSGPPDYPEADDDPSTRRGFDRLRTHGFTIAEVAALRSYFTPQVQAYAARQPPLEGEPAEERRYRMEEEWQERQGEASEFALNTNRVMAQRALRRTEAETRVLAVEHGAGSGRDFTWGFIMGFTLGFISLFWLFNIPMSHQQKMGLIAGTSCNLVYSILRRQELEAAMGAPQPDDDIPTEMPDGSAVGGQAVAPPAAAGGQGVGQ